MKMCNFNYLISVFPLDVQITTSNLTQNTQRYEVHLVLFSIDAVDTAVKLMGKHCVRLYECVYNPHSQTLILISRLHFNLQTLLYTSRCDIYKLKRTLSITTRFLQIFNLILHVSACVVIIKYYKMKKTLKKVNCNRRLIIERDIFVYMKEGIRKVSYMCYNFGRYLLVY